MLISANNIKNEDCKKGVGAEVTPDLLRRDEYTAIRCHNTPCDPDPSVYKINLLHYGGGFPLELPAS